jgi:two-component system response regulator RegA
MTEAAERDAIAPKLLVIDDDETFAQLMARRMRRAGYVTHVAHNAEQAIAVLREHGACRAVLDLKLGPDSGLALLPRLKRIDPDLEVVVLTGYSSIATAVEAIKLGAINYLCKPASSDAILEAFTANCGDPGIDLASKPPSIHRLEWEHIQKVLVDNDGNVSESARMLGMHRRTLQRKLRKFPVKR